MEFEIIEWNMIYNYLYKYNSKVDWKRFFQEHRNKSENKILQLISSMCWIDNSIERDESKSDIFLEENKNYQFPLLSPLNKYGSGINYVVYVLTKINFKESILIVGKEYKSNLHKIHFELLEETFKDVYKLLFKEDLEVSTDKNINTSKQKIYVNIDPRFDYSIVPCKFSNEFTEFIENIWFELNKISNAV